MSPEDTGTSAESTSGVTGNDCMNHYLTDTVWKDLIDDCAATGKDRVINNGSSDHAAYLIEKFFSSAEDEVLIFTGELFPYAFGKDSVIEKAITFLKKTGRRIRVIFEFQDVTPDSIKKNPLISSIMNAKEIAGTLEVYDGRSFNGKVNHFAVMDKKAYRYELEHQNSIAIANFGDHNFAKNLSELFEAIAAGSTRISLGV